MGKRGQVTIFIILGVIIVTGIGAFIFFSEKDFSSFGNSGDGASITSVTSCIEKVINENYPTIIKNGGQLNPQLYVNYADQNYTMLCYTGDLFVPCVNYYPLLKEQIAQEIVDVSSSEVEKCFTTFIKEYERQGYSVSAEETDHEITFLESTLESKINKKLIFTKENNTEVFEEFKTIIPTKSSKLLDLASRIVNEESEYCSFDVGSYMQMYPEYSIFKTAYEGGTTLYELKYRETGEEFNFAVKSCTLL